MPIFAPRIRKFTILQLVDPFLIIVTIYELSLSDPRPGVEKNIFREINQFYTFKPKIFSPRGGGHEIYNFLFRYPIDSRYHI